MSRRDPIFCSYIQLLVRLESTKTRRTTYMSDCRKPGLRWHYVLPTCMYLVSILKGSRTTTYVHYCNQGLSGRVKCIFRGGIVVLKVLARLALDKNGPNCKPYSRIRTSRDADLASRYRLWSIEKQESVLGFSLSYSVGKETGRCDDLILMQDTVYPRPLSPCQLLHTASS